MQLRFIYIIIFSLALLYCQEKSKEIRYYPSKKLYNSSSSVKINLDTTTLNFIGITSQVNQIYKENKIPLIEIIDRGINKRIIPLTFDEMKKRNVLSISSDSILIDNGYPINDLKFLLKRHYSNNGNDFRYPSSNKKAIVEITLDTSKKGKDLKKTLINLTRTFDEINTEFKDSLELQVYFNYLRQIPLPPLPSEEID